MVGSPFRMSLELPSLRFQPGFELGGASRFHLPLLYDLVALRRPARTVILGWGDGGLQRTICAALREHHPSGRCATIRRARDGEDPADDESWQNAIATNTSEVALFLAAAPETKAWEFADASVDLLLLDDCDSALTAQKELKAWRPKLAPGALLLFHGLALERTPPLRPVWEEAVRGQAALEFSEGIGLGLALWQAQPETAGELLRALFSSDMSATMGALHQALAQRLIAEARAAAAETQRAALDLRQVWLDTVLADRWRAQEVMDHQTREIEHQQQRLAYEAQEAAERARAFTELRRDRLKAQLIMDTQAEQVKQWVGKGDALAQENKKLKSQLAQAKKVIEAAKKACWTRARCFGAAATGEKKKKRPIPERIARELRRIPGKFNRTKAAPPGKPAKAEKAKAATPTPAERYPKWIAEHEPDAAGLAAQRAAASAMLDGPTLSLLLPTFNPPRAFFEELIEALAAQTYPRFEICVADGGSNAETRQVLQRWQKNEPRLRLDLLPENLGIAENTNRALALATGDFFACIDQDDLLPPFALYEMARAIVQQPEADIFYSDEDRLDAKGQRHAPFFKPEWSPEYLLSSMYIGHLTAYRRTLVDRVGTFRKEFDLSQDYDFALRATEIARAVGHVPHVLYHWREHAASGSAGGKPHARTSNLAALADAMERRGLPAEIIAYPTANRARLKITTWPRVSIIVPTDSPERARACAEELPRMTDYPDYEIVIVTNSALAESLEREMPAGSPAKLVRYDEPFNFSAKSNLGAHASTGARLIFFNDDVESAQRDWIQNVIEPLENPAVGAVSPKLLYETGKIQHAGLVTGVRGLVGTACHQWPGDSTDYTNFAQSMRNASALSAACLAMRREDFFAVGEFDAVQTPIAHSDLDLCFKVRAAGMRCVYTPFATMTHRGHASIGAVEEEETKSASSDRAGVFLLQRWTDYTCHDPYFPPNVRDWLYADSPTPIRMWAPNESAASLDGNARALLFVSHDLSWSGVPLILLSVAEWCRARGYFVVMLSPVDGPVRKKFIAAGVPVIADPLINQGHPSFGQLAREFDCVVASTIFAAPIVRAAHAEGIPHLWWIHEGRVAEHYLGEDANLRRALSEAELIVTPDTVSSQVYQPFSDRPVRVLPYGIPDPNENEPAPTERSPGPVKFLLLGTIEQRKGQRFCWRRWENWTRRHCRMRTSKSSVVRTTHSSPRKYAARPKAIRTSPIAKVSRTRRRWG